MHASHQEQTENFRGVNKNEFRVTHVLMGSFKNDENNLRHNYVKELKYLRIWKILLGLP